MGFYTNQLLKCSFYLLENTVPFISNNYIHRKFIVTINKKRRRRKKVILCPVAYTVVISGANLALLWS